jgi:DNA polymerase-3 subunit gamma/tau
MKNMNPQIVAFPAVEVVVPNTIIKEELEQIKGSIVNTLKRDLRNGSITVSILVDEHQEPVKILSRREQFEELVKENKAVQELRDAFDLVLA